MGRMVQEGGGGLGEKGGMGWGGWGGNRWYATLRGTSAATGGEGVEWGQINGGGRGYFSPKCQQG